MLSSTGVLFASNPGPLWNRTKFGEVRKHLKVQFQNRKSTQVPRDGSMCFCLLYICEFVSLAGDSKKGQFSGMKGVRLHLFSQDGDTLFRMTAHFVRKTHCDSHPIDFQFRSREFLNPKLCWECSKGRRRATRKRNCFAHTAPAQR